MSKQASIRLNVLAGNVENACRIMEAAKGDAYIGVMVKNYADDAAAIAAVAELQAADVAVSVGLGAGDPAQWAKVARVAAASRPAHVNQVYPAAGYTLAALQAADSTHTLVNALIRPGSQAGRVSILTGPASAAFADEISCEAAAALLAEIGIHSVKFYPIGGAANLPAVAAMTKAAVERGITMFEPTGGIDVHSVAAVVETCLAQGATCVVPHLYTALIDPATKMTDPAQVGALLERLRNL